MVKILLLVGNYLPGYKSGGALRSTVNMVERLGRDFEFNIITSDRDMGDDLPYSNRALNQWKTVGNASVYYLSPKPQSLINIAKIIKNTEYDILYLNSFFNPYFSIFPLLLRQVRMLPSKPIILATRGEFAKGALNLKKSKKTIFMFLANVLGLYRNILWQASSKFEANDISKIMKRWNPRILIAPNIPKYLEPSSYKESNLRDTSKPLKICFLGRIAPVKNLDFALDVLLKSKISCIFDIYGPMEDVSYWNKCLDIIKLLPLTIKISYKGPIENTNVHKMLKRYDLFFLPTKGENFGHVILESMSSGTPVLIANTTPWRNLEKHGVGWDISLESPDKFISAIEKISLIKKDDYIEFRNSVRNYAEKFANDDSILDSSRQLFNNAIEDKDV